MNVPGHDATPTDLLFNAHQTRQCILIGEYAVPLQIMRNEPYLLSGIFLNQELVSGGIEHWNLSPRKPNSSRLALKTDTP